MKLTLSDAGLEFIKKEEFFVPHSYQDSAGILTIGYGSTRWADGRKVHAGETITEPEAVALLLHNVNEKIQAISPLIKQPINQNQQDAVISLAYNIGSGGFATSTVLSRINDNPEGVNIQEAWMRWNKIHFNGKIKELPGLTERRKREYIIYKS